MSYVELAPPAALRGVATCLWRSTIPDRPRRAPILPDGCVDLIWESGRGAFLAGPDTGPVPDHTPGGRTLVGVRLRPGAGGTLLGVPLEPLRNLRPDLTDLRPGAALRLPGDLPPAEALRRLVALTGALSRERPPDPALLEAVRLLRDPRVRVPSLGDRLGIGDRQLRRRFSAAVGYGPKTLQRIFRFRRFLSLLGQGSAAELAALAGYTDQAHLTRETVEFAGLTPAVLARARTVDQQ
ncbi:helix-turn-helix domain-containing protein [Actinoplanes oblitus]|uniref:Helix-turn-helix domain-containing protein n=1 Tax=Actinoplanes oblitus TaxID=3040509 RepID=A0ABY8W4B5_9ACTN|nr:helix-turn-helix domain-containing protein [Actinoplanes oblitus]WIM92543.1 helix-turn-helix domain-containing protein [Actinoplanes oblitus]